jgi:hypothetical protein
MEMREVTNKFEKPKTWGPFTGRQLTTMTCVIAVMLLFPVGAWAVSGSNVFVTDAHTGAHAAVDSHGNVATKISGAVTTGEQTSQFRQSPLKHLGITGTILFVPPAGKAFVMTELQLDWNGVDTTMTSYVGMALGDPSACNNASSKARMTFDLPTSRDFRSIEFTPGFVIPSGKGLCVYQFSTGSVDAMGFGYLVNSTAVVSPF